MEIPGILLKKMFAAKRVVVMTGAGVSAESGVATFRDPGGLWSKFNPMELASIEGFMSNPERVWEWYQYRRKIVADAEPNPGHFAIAEMESLFDNFALITQNVDRLHQRAGSNNVCELHGNIIDNRCFVCGIPFDHEISSEEKVLPRCSECGGMIRPSVVWFGEMLPQDAIEFADSVSYRSDLFFSVGTSAEIYPAAGLPYTAKRGGAFVVEVNPNVTSLSALADIQLKAPSGVALPALIAAFKEFKDETKNN